MSETPVIRVNTAGGVVVAVPIHDLREQIGGDLFDTAISACVGQRLRAAVEDHEGALAAVGAGAPSGVNETLTANLEESP